MIIIQKNFYDGEDFQHLGKVAVDQYNKWEEEKKRDAEYREGASKYLHSLAGKKPHELTAIGAVDPAKKDEMIQSHADNTMKEGIERMTKPEYWRDYLSGKGRENTEAGTTGTGDGNGSGQVGQDTKSPKISPQNVSLPSGKAEVEPSAPVSEDEKAGLSMGAKAGLATAGVVALGAGGYAAYKALKKRQAKKKAQKEEVNRFLEEKYNTTDNKSNK